MKISKDELKRIKGGVTLISPTMGKEPVVDVRDVISLKGEIIDTLKL